MVALLHIAASVEAEIRIGSVLDLPSAVIEQGELVGVAVALPQVDLIARIGSASTGHVQAKRTILAAHRNCSRRPHALNRPLASSSPQPRTGYHLRRFGASSGGLVRKATVGQARSDNPSSARMLGIFFFNPKNPFLACGQVTWSYGRGRSIISTPDARTADLKRFATGPSGR